MGGWLEISVRSGTAVRYRGYFQLVVTLGGTQPILLLVIQLIRAQFWSQNGWSYGYNSPDLASSVYQCSPI